MANDYVTWDGRQKWARPDNSIYPHWDRDAVKRAIEERMLCGAPFVVGDMTSPLGHPWCRETRGLIESAVKRLKKAGLIEFTRYGGRVVWKATAP